MKLAPKQLRNIVIAAFLHDIGKLNIPYMILNKVEKLTTQEFDVIKKHAEYGHYILKSKDEFTMIAEYVKCHHERWDGKGYPRGIKGNRIPLISRIISVADAYEAMLAERPYRKAMNKSKAISEIVNNSGTQFDPNIVMMFQRVL